MRTSLVLLGFCMVVFLAGCPQNAVLDSDGDGIPDNLEAAGDADGDGLPNYLDPDSDGDLLADGIEDANHNGIVDAGESSPLLADTDGDGAGDMVETALQQGSQWVTNPAQTPASNGIFYFVVPYSAGGSKAPIPTTSPMGLATSPSGGAPVPLDVYARASGAMAPVDVVASLLVKMAPNPGGGTDAVTLTACATFSSGSLIDHYAGPKATAGTDGVTETITGVNPIGSTYCFDIVPKANTSIGEKADAQVFTVNIDTYGDNTGTAYPLGTTRTVTFVVPPAAP